MRRCPDCGREKLLHDRIQILDPGGSLVTAKKGTSFSRRCLLVEHTDLETGRVSMRPDHREYDKRHAAHMELRREEGAV